MLAVVSSQHDILFCYPAFVPYCFVRLIVPLNHYNKKLDRFVVQGSHAVGL